MNVYDFDHTLYPGDVSIDFWKWCVCRHPWLLWFLPYQCIVLGAWLMGLYSRQRFKESFFVFLRRLPDVSVEVSSFWQSKKTRVFSWYLAERQQNDVIISASPSFLVKNCPWLLPSTTVIATDMNPLTGKIRGKNCHGEEKVRRFYEVFPTVKMDCFYSDSQSDTPLANLAKQAFLVLRQGERVPWEARTPSPFLTLQFLRFLFCGGFNVLTGVLFSWGFSLVLQANVAFVAGYTFSHLCAYFLNAYLVFKDKPHLVGYFRFCIAYLPNFAIQFILVFIAYNVLAFPKITTYAVAAFLGVPITFLCLRFYAFRKRKRSL